MYQARFMDCRVPDVGNDLTWKGCCSMKARIAKEREKVLLYRLAQEEENGAKVRRLLRELGMEMIDVAAEIGVILDDTWFEEIMGEPGTTPDMGLTSYWKNFFQTALIEENEARAERGEAPLDFSF